MALQRYAKLGPRQHGNLIPIPSAQAIALNFAHLKFVSRFG